MTTEEQLDIIKAFQEGTPVYYRSVHLDDEFSWKPVPAGHQFDFTSNVYHKNTPITFEESLVQRSPREAFHLSMSHLNKHNLCFMRDCTMTDERGRETDRIRMVNVNDLYKLWNLAMQYGHGKKDDINLITDKDGLIYAR